MKVYWVYRRKVHNDRVCHKWSLPYLWDEMTFPFETFTALMVKGSDLKKRASIFSPVKPKITTLPFKGYVCPGDLIIVSV